MKKKNILKELLLIIVCSFILISPLKVNAEATDVKISGIREMKIGESQTLTTEVIKTEDDNETYKIDFKSSDETIATVDSTGKITALKSGTANIIITIENTTIQKSFEIKIEEEQLIEPVLSDDATLKSLSIKGYELNKTFQSDITDYEVTIPSNVRSLTINRVLNHPNASIQIDGNSSLKDGDIIKIIVTAENKETTKIYKIKIHNEIINLDLKSLKIIGQSLNETFSPLKTDYTLDVAYDIAALNIEAKAESSDVEIEISGAKSLDVGTNTITITVKSKTTTDKKVYRIIVTREEKEQDKENDNKENNNTSDNNNSTTSDIKPSKDNNQNQSSSKNNIAKYVLVTIGCIVLFAIGSVGIYFYIKTGEPKKKKNKNVKVNESQQAKEEVKNSKKIYDYEEDNFKKDNLEDTKEFKKEALVHENENKTTKNNSQYSEDVLKDIEDLFDDE